MNCNVGKTDRVVRLTLAAGMILYGQITNNYWGLLGIIPMVTGVLNFCPLYKVLGLSTWHGETKRVLQEG